MKSSRAAQVGAFSSAQGLTVLLAAGGGSSWLYPFVDGHPPIGWDDASRYMVLPVLLVVFQFVSTAIISPPVQQEEEEKNGALQKALTIGLPFMVGWFALNLPAGLSLYYFSNITLTSAQQIWLRKLGGGSPASESSLDCRKTSVFDDFKKLLDLTSPGCLRTILFLGLILTMLVPIYEEGLKHCQLQGPKHLSGNRRLASTRLDALASQSYLLVLLLLIQK